MNCREFGAQHCAFVDDTLSAADMAAMRDHLERCPSCSALDTRVRRSLLVVRNSPRVECSPDFGRRLQARLRELGPVDRHVTAAPGLLRSVGRYVAFAASLVAAGFIGALATSPRAARTPEVQLPPVVASIPEADPAPVAMTDPAYVASMMSGLPVWSALIVAGQSSAHMANHEFQLAGYGQ